MKKTKIIYWILTILFGGFMIFSSIPDAMLTQAAIDLVSTHLGYPVYFVRFIGIAKIIGAFAILIPGIPTKLKNWAYAGLLFDLIGATYSILAVGDPISGMFFMMPPIIIGFLSYIWYYKVLKFREDLTTREDLTLSE